MTEIFIHQVARLKKLNIQRIIWLVLSAFFVIFLGIVFFTWDSLVQLHNINVLRIISIIVISVTVSWWYWTMILINKLISYRSVEIQILKEITKDLVELKQLIKK